MQWSYIIKKRKHIVKCLPLAREVTEDIVTRLRLSVYIVTTVHDYHRAKFNTKSE